MDFITRLALKNRLLHFLLISISLSFIGVAAFFYYTEYHHYHESLDRELTNNGKLVEASIGGALVYGADWASLETMEKLLEYNNALDLVALYRSDGTLSGSAIRDGASDHQPPPFRHDGGTEYTAIHHNAYIPIHIGGNEEAVGLLVMRANHDYIDGQMLRFLLSQLVALLVVLVLTFGFGRKLQQAIGTAYQRQQERLEEKVKQRTAQLQQAHDRLQGEVQQRQQVELELKAEHRGHIKLIGKLEQAQNQLLQSEKMASIGQLAAGVAHEINNPVGYISSNLNSLHGYIGDLIDVLKAYGEADKVLQAFPEPAEKIQAAKVKADIHFLVEDVTALVGESQEGVERVKQIVQALKDFSRTDAREYQMYDLHRGIESTLKMAHNETKYKAEVVTEFGELPEVYCCLAQINQVVLNLLVNAAQAIESRGTIFLRTGVVGDQVWIEVEDTGKGIAAEDLKRIYEPFFTTKPVGKGTGLGLSLSYGILQDHGGRIEVHSEVGVGTRFRLWLPIEGQEQDFGTEEAV